MLEDIAAQGAQRTICLGDLVGFNADPNPCVELIRNRNIPCVRGNHDSVAGGLKEPTKFSAQARRTIEWTLDQLSPENKTYLASLSLLLDFDDFTIVHGSLHPEPNDDTRMMSREEAKKSFDALKILPPLPPGEGRGEGRITKDSTRASAPRLCFFGHTHHYLIFESQNDSISISDLDKVQLKPGASYLINPGSVGQQRSSDWRASWILYDSDHQIIRRIRTRYDRALTRKKNIAAGLEEPQPVFSRAADFVAFHAYRAKNTAKNIIRSRNPSSRQRPLAAMKSNED